MTALVAERDTFANELSEVKAQLQASRDEAASVAARATHAETDAATARASQLAAEDATHATIARFERELDRAQARADTAIEKAEARADAAIEKAGARRDKLAAEIATLKTQSKK